MNNDQVFNNLTEIPPPPSPEILLQKMGKAAYELENANRFIQKHFKTKKNRVEKARTIILSRNFQLLTNQKLAAHLANLYAVNEKYKPTIDDLDNFIFLECQEIMEQFQEAELVAKQAVQEHDMWSKQLSWHQSELKHQGIEMSILGTNT